MKYFITAYVIFALAAAYGYACNILALIHAAADGSAISLMLLLRILGVFLAPFGAVLGYF